MWCVLRFTQPHVADAKGGHGKEFTYKNKNKKEYLVSRFPVDTYLTQYYAGDVTALSTVCCNITAIA